MLYKVGSLLKIAAASVAFDDVVVEKQPSAQNKVIEPKNAEFLYFRARAISAGDQGPQKGEPNPNGNGDYFPRKELEASYQTFNGRNLFLNHESDHPVKSIGKILDAYSVEDPETGEYYIECLAKIDRKLHPEIARKVETGELNTVSMGCSCEASMCSVCGLTIHSDDDEKCDHLSPRGILKNHIAEVDLPQYGIKRGEPVLAFSINSGLSFNELSIVNVPADSSAFIKGVIASNLRSKISKNAKLDEVEQRHLKAVLDNLDDDTKKKIQADFCGCPVPKEDKKMSDNVTSAAGKPSALSKLNALEYMEFAEWMENKLEKAASTEVPKVETPKEEVKTDDTIVDKAINAVKNSALGKLFSNAVKKEIEKASKPEDKRASLTVRAEFTSNKEFGKSSWALFKGDKKVLQVSAEQLWDEKELSDPKYQAWTSSKEYGNKLVETFNRVGFSKTAEILGIGFKKEAKGEVKKPEGEFFKPGSDSSNKEHDVKTTYEIGKPEGSFSKPKAPGAPEDVKTDYTLDKPGKEQGQKGPAAPKPTDVKTEYDVKKPEGSFAKPKAAPEGKDIETDYKAGDHLESSKPESEKEASKITAEDKDKFIKKHIKKHIKDDKMEQDQAVAVALNEAREKGYDVPAAPKKGSEEETKLVKEAMDYVEAEPVAEPALKTEEVPMDEPKLDEAQPAESPMDKPKEEPMAEAHSAFDKLDEGIVLSDGMHATKDREHNEIVVTDQSGTEVKRLPDGFGMDVPSVMKLLQAIVGVPAAEETPAPEAPAEVPAEAPIETPKEEAPRMEEPVDMAASKKDELTKQAEELAKKEAELKKAQDEINAKKFASAIHARAEHCKKIVATMIQKDMVAIEESDVDAAIKQGSTLLDARQSALKAAISRKVKTLLAMDDTSLKAFEDSVNDVKIEKKASSRLTTALNLGYSIPTEDDEIKSIFDSMGNGGGIR